MVFFLDLVRVPEFMVLDVGSVGEREVVRMLSTGCLHSLVSPLVAGLAEESNGKDVDDEKTVARDVDVERVQVSRSPFSLEDLWSNSISSCPSDD